MKLLKYLVLTISLLALTTSLCVAAPTGKTQQLTSPDQVPEGLAKSDWTSIRAAYEAGRHAFQPIAGGWQARNPGQQWTTKFDGRGFVSEPKGGGWQWGLELKRYGFPGAELAISGVPEVKAEGQRLTYGWDTAVQEWWVNDARGLEHGFTVRERPAASSDAAALLQFDLAVRGSLTPQIAAHGLGVQFRDGAGDTVITYSGLKVWDADGKILPSHFAPLDTRHPSLVTLLVDERGARYPLTIDPIAQQAYLKASNTDAGDYFGYSVAVSGDTVVVGAVNEDSNATGVNGDQTDNSAPNSGAAYVFVRNGTNWTQQAYLKASNTGAGDSFGDSVAVAGDTVVVGAYGEDSNATGVNGDQTDNSAPSSGAAYVFVRNGTHWTQQAYLKASNTGWGDQFGFSAAVSGGTLVVGAYGEDSNATGVNGDQNDNSADDSGAAYVFVRNGTNWTQQAYLKASDTEASDRFGFSVAVSGDTVVIGTVIDWVGAAYVFVRNGTNWSQQALLNASNVGHSFGYSVAVSGDTVVVGAFHEDSIAWAAGAAYVFVRSGTNWSEQAYLKASNAGHGACFGYSVAVSGDTVVVGAHGESGSTGAAYVFVRDGTNWSEQAYLKANPVGVDNFGYSVAVSGDTVVVGAVIEASNATGVNGNSSDNSAADSGAAYIFTGLGPVPVVPEPEIAVEQPAGTDLVDGTATVSYGSVGVGATSSLAFTIKNTGTADLAGLGITIDGTDAAQFTVTANPTAPVSGPSGSTTFTVQFTPTSAGVKTAALHIANNDANENPFDINLTGPGVSPFALTGLAQLVGSFQFGFTNASGLPFTVLTSTNVELPLSNWTELGAPIEAPPGQYQFTDPQATNYTERFYRVRSP